MYKREFPQLDKPDKGHYQLPLYLMIRKQTFFSPKIKKGKDIYFAHLYTTWSKR